jgi:uncharacterized protein
MFTTFQKAVLGTIAGAAILIALVVAAKGPGAPLVAGGGTSAYATPVNFNQPIQPGIVTTGDATVHVKPDVAIITVSAVVQGPTAAEAQSAVAERVSRILQKAKDLGIADKDTKSAGYNIQPQYASGPNQAPKITGYQATQQILLTYHNVDNTGKALDALVQGDAGNTISLRFTLDDPKSAQADARSQAIADARSKADAMAKAAGVSLGKVIAISDLSASSPTTPEFGRAAVPAAAPVVTQVPTGDLDVTVRVQVQFAIQ